MDLDEYMQDGNHWNRILLNTLWVITVIGAFIGIFFAFSANRDIFYIQSHILYPVIWMTIILLGLEISFRWVSHYIDYLMILGCCILSFVFIYSNYEMKALLLTLTLPINISIFYFQRSKIIFAVVLSLSSFIILIFIRLAPLPYYSSRDLITVIPILSFTCYVALRVVNRGYDLIHNLKEATESKQELMIRNILMDKLSKMDALTDLYNHITFHEYLGKLIEQSESIFFTIHLAVLDIDNFKKVNDTYGHRAGDAVLRKVSAIIKSRIGSNDFAARYGGEEFAVIFTEKSGNEVFELLEKIRWKISQTNYDELEGNSVTVSIGMHEYVMGSTKEDLFSGADKSLYTAKKSGKNKTIIYDVDSKIS